MDYKESCEGKYDHQRSECKGEVIENITLNQVYGVSPAEFPKYKVPVIIAELTAEIDVESKIRLGEPAIEIKRIKKNVFLTQCRLISGTRKLFLKGFVRKNIEYATLGSSGHLSICGDIKHTTVEVPFHCSVDVSCMREPHIQTNCPVKETIYIDKKGLGRDMREIDTFSEEHFNERIYCELVKSRICQADIIEKCESIEKHSEEKTFNTFIEKDVILLTIKLLQNQQVWSIDNCGHENSPMLTWSPADICDEQSGTARL